MASGSSLRLPAPLVSALAPRRGDDAPNDGGGPPGGSTAVIRALAVHPSLPRAACLAEEASVPATPPASASKKSKGPPSPKSAVGTQQETAKRQRLVVRRYERNGSGNGNDNGILAALPMERLPPAIERFRRPRSRSSKVSNQPLTLASLGPLQSIAFLDREAIFWQTRRHIGSPSNLDAASLVEDEKEEVVLGPDSDWNAVDGGMGRGLCLGLKFARVLVVLRFDAFDEVTVLCCLEGQRSSGKDKDGHIQSTINYTPTSALVPLTESVVVYGCSDGAMRFHNLVPSALYSTGRNEPPDPSSPSSGGGVKSTRRQATIKSVRGPNGRDDPVVEILNVDPTYGEGHRAAAGDGIAVSHQVGGGVASESNDATLVIRSRLLTVCSSGVAFLWDVRVAIDRPSGALRDLNVLPPLVRIDGLGSLTMSPRKPLGSFLQAPDGGFWGRAAAAATSKEGNSIAAAPYARVAPSISYDPHRQLLTWALPADAPAAAVGHRGDYELESLSPNSPQAKKEQEDRLFFDKWVLENGGFVKVWDFNLVDALLSSAGPSSSPRPPPKMPPVAVMKLPTTIASAISPQSMVAGLPHTPIATASLACVCLSKDGSKLLVLAAPLHDAINPVGTTQSSSIPESPMNSNRKTLGTSKVAKPKILYINGVPCHSVSLSDSAMSPFARGLSVVASPLAPDFVGVATDDGVVVANLADGDTWSSKLDFLSDNRRSRNFRVTGLSSNYNSCSTHTHSSTVLAGPIHTIISIGGVGNRAGIVHVENHAVYASRLSTTRPPNDGLVEKVDLPDPVMLCKLRGKVPWRTIGSTRMAHFVQSSMPMISPPRLISSPSGRYLCLYWGGEKRFEILHAGSLLAREQNNQGGPANALDPFIDSGSNILSFAWVGDDDNFATIRNRVAPATSNPKSLEGDFRWDPKSTTLTSEGKQGRPQVELFKLAEVKVDAVELAAGASVAAATTVRLGSLTVRGGDRFIPNVLFGGPALCVGCLSVSDGSNTSNHEGIAYFYSRKSGDIEKHDERASVYISFGTSIPYPDLVTWDEFGQLCATAYGSRVAVYLSEQTRFILLGSIQVAGSESSGAELPLISLKFIHGVLYCSTPSSVHVIFLGNLDDDGTVCELDSFAIATEGAPLHGIYNPDLSSPVPVITALIQPHILAYHSGGLIISTPCGLRLLPLSHPIIRIGALLAANLIDRARKWILAIPKSDHDNLAHFLIRRGHPDLAISDLNGLSLETYIDLCMRYDHTDELEHLIDSHGSEIVCDICDWGRAEANGGYSGYFAIGMCMLSRGKVQVARKLVTQASESGMSELLADAMKLATFISVADQPGGNALLQKVTHAMDLNPDLASVNIVN